MTQDSQLTKMLIDDIKGLTDAISELNQIVTTLRVDTTQSITELQKDVASLQEQASEKANEFHHWHLVLSSLASSVLTLFIQHLFHWH